MSIQSFNNKEIIKNILSSHGYKFKDHDSYLTCQACFRGGNDDGSVVIYPEKCAIDFVTSNIYNIQDFIMLVTGKKSIDELNNYLSINNFELKSSSDASPKIKQIKIFDNSFLNELSPNYDYWINRGIDKKILEELKSGLFKGKKGIWKNRYIFPIFNNKNQIIALNGRDVTNNVKRPKWIFKSSKSVVYPAFINLKDIKEKNSVILVESIGDFLSLATCGIRNCLVLFGTELNLSILNFLLKIHIGKIVISTNDDKLKNNAGNIAAEKIQKKLSKYFNKNSISIKLPSGEKDWNEVLIKYGKQEIIEQWHKI